MPLKFPQIWYVSEQMLSKDVEFNFLRYNIMSYLINAYSELPVCTSKKLAVGLSHLLVIPVLNKVSPVLRLIFLGYIILDLFIHTGHMNPNSPFVTVHKILILMIAMFALHTCINNAMVGEYDGIALFACYLLWQYKKGNKSCYYEEWDHAFIWLSFNYIL